MNLHSPESAILSAIIKVNGKEYGFINLSKITYGEYLDLTRFDEITIDDGKIIKDERNGK